MIKKLNTNKHSCLSIRITKQKRHEVCSEICIKQEQNYYLIKKRLLLFSVNVVIKTYLYTDMTHMSMTVNHQHVQWRHSRQLPTDLAAILTVVGSRPVQLSFLQCGRVACHAEHCISHGNSVRPSVCHTLVPYPDE